MYFFAGYLVNLFGVKIGREGCFLGHVTLHCLGVVKGTKSGIDSSLESPEMLGNGLSPLDRCLSWKKQAAFTGVGTNRGDGVRRGREGRINVL